MSGVREAALHALGSLVAFGRVVASKVTGDTKTVTVDVEGNTAGSTKERRTSQQLWGHPAVLYRPKSDGVSFEVVFVRQGEQAVPVAAREIRWQVDLNEGDVCLRNLDGANPVRLWLKADGNCVLEANEIKLGDSGATEAIALGTVLKSHLQSLKTYIDAIAAAYAAHNHPTAPTGPVSPPSVAIAGSNPSVPDIESRHKVEN